MRALSWLLALAACGSSSTKPLGPSNTPTPGVTPAEDTVTLSPSELPPITTPCVINAANGQSSATSSGKSATSCNASAECVAHPSVPKPGDGLIAVVCNETECRCETRVAVAGRSGWAQHHETFDHTPACGDPEVAKQLIVEHCNAKLLPSPDAQ